MQVLLWLSLLTYFIYTHSMFNLTDHNYSSKQRQVLTHWLALPSDVPAPFSCGGHS